MKSRSRIYLSHSVYEMRKGRRVQRRLEELGYVVYNPFYPETPREDVKSLDEGKLDPWGVRGVEEARQIVEQDLKALRSCDLIICLFPRRRTVGITAEMTVAWMVYNISVLSVVPEDMRGHPWILVMSERVFTSLEDLYSYLRHHRVKHGKGM